MLYIAYPEDQSSRHVREPLRSLHDAFIPVQALETVIGSSTLPGRHDHHRACMIAIATVSSSPSGPHLSSRMASLSLQLLALTPLWACDFSLLSYPAQPQCHSTAGVFFYWVLIAQSVSKQWSLSKLQTTYSTLTYNFWQHFCYLSLELSTIMAPTKAASSQEVIDQFWKSSLTPVKPPNKGVSGLLQTIRMSETARRRAHNIQCLQSCLAMYTRRWSSSGHQRGSRRRRALRPRTRSRRRCARRK